MMDRDVLDEAIQAQLAADTELQVGLSDVPAEVPDIPYYILNHSPSPPPEGSMADKEDMPYYDYMLKSVGRDNKETARTSSRGRRSLRSHYPAVAGGVIIEIRTISLGVISRAMGPSLFEVNDIYRICVSEGA